MWGGRAIGFVGTLHDVVARLFFNCGVVRHWWAGAVPLRTADDPSPGCDKFGRCWGGAEVEASDFCLQEILHVECRCTAENSAVVLLAMSAVWLIDCLQSPNSIQSEQCVLSTFTHQCSVSPSVSGSEAEKEPAYPSHPEEKS